MKYLIGIVLFAVANINLFANCDCSNDVQTNYQQITQKVSNSYEESKQKLEEVNDNLNTSIQYLKQQNEVLDKEISNRENLFAQKSQELFTLEKIADTLIIESKIDSLSATTHIELNKNTLLNDAINTNQVINEDTKDLFSN